MWTYFAFGSSAISSFFGVPREALGLGGGRHAALGHDVRLLDGLLAPRAREEVVGRGAVFEEVHGHHGELQARAALEAEDLVAVRDAHQLFDERDDAVVDGLELGRPVAALHDGHAGPFVVEELGLHALEHRQRQGRRAGVEVEHPVDHLQAPFTPFRPPVGPRRSDPRHFAVNSSRSSSMMSPMRSRFSVVDAPMWGAMSTFFAWRSGEPSGGSLYQTSVA